MNKNLLIVGILVLLVVVSAIQSVQLNSIRSNIDGLGTTTTVKSSTSSSTKTSASSSASVPTNLQNLPGMVGGC